MYQKKHQDMIQRQYKINRELESHHEGNSEFKTALSMLVTLASKATEIFQSSTIDEKRHLIGYVFSNLEMEGVKLYYELNTPFNLFVNVADSQKWHPVIDTVRTNHSLEVITLYEQITPQVLETLVAQ